MEYDTGAFLTELDADDVNGIIVIEVDEESEQYRLAEKWDPSDDDTYSIDGEHWSVYWVSAEAMAERVEEGSVEYKQQLSDKQLRGVRNLAGIEDTEKVAA